MDICFLSESSISVYITKEELLCRGVSPDSFGADEAALLLREAIGDGIDSCEVELYSSGGDVMLFVERLEAAARYYYFAGLEDLIAAVSLISSLPSSLWYTESGYVLALFGAEADMRISEYARELKVNPLFSDHLSEHARLIARGNAVKELKDAFFRGGSKKMPEN